jgi:signal transduction histidine kinase
MDESKGLAGAEMPSVPLPGARILVVDDEEPVLELLHDILSEYPYKIDLAPTGEEAIARIQTEVFDLVLTDLNLPGTDGLGVLRAAKEKDHDVAVVLLTGNATVFNAIEALRKGAYDFVQKPFQLGELEASLSRALEWRAFALRERQEEAIRKKIVEEARARQRTLYAIAKEITESFKLDATLSRIVERSLDLCSAQQGLLFLLEDSTGQIVCRVDRGIESAGQRERLIQLLSAPNKKALYLKMPVHEKLENAQEASREAYVVPLVLEDVAIGTIAVISGAGRPMEEDTPDLLPQLAGMASIAIRNVRSYEKARELDRLKSEFVAVVSHEVRTPLTSIKGSLEILTDSRYFQVSEKQSELLQISQANVERLEQLITSILDFSKLESGTLSTSFEEIRPEHVLESVVSEMRNLASREGIEICLEVESPLPVIEADELRLVRVLTNLVSNAVKAVKVASRGGKIRVRATGEDDGLRVDVIDQGIGIAPEDLPKLFIKFQQLDSSNTRISSGTGLGLVISKGIIEEHGGRIWVTSEKGKGSTFSFWVPRIRTIAPGVKPAAAATTELPPESSARAA